MYAISTIFTRRFLRIANTQAKHLLRMSISTSAMCSISDSFVKDMQTITFQPAELKVRWQDFMDNIKKALKCVCLCEDPQAMIEKLKFCFVDDADFVTKAHFDNFCKWFKSFDGSNLNLVPDHTASGGYHAASPVEDCFQLQEVTETLTPQWFFGFITAVRSKELLLTMPPGSFLVRFSSSPRVYTISAHYLMNDGRRDVGNWRIENVSQKGKHYFKFGSQYFASLNEFVAKYTNEGELLPVENGRCKLSIAADRSLYILTSLSCRTTNASAASISAGASAPSADSHMEQLKTKFMQLLKEKEVLEAEKKVMEQQLRKQEEEMKLSKAKLKEKKLRLEEQRKAFEEEKKKWEFEVERRKLQHSVEVNPVNNLLYQWLQGFGMERYYPKFVDEEITYESIMYVEKEDLERMDIKSVPQRKLLAEISKLSANKL